MGKTSPNIRENGAMDLRASLGELFGTATLLLVVIGSGIMATNISSDVGVQLTINSAATGLMLYILITLLGPGSEALMFLGISAQKLLTKIQQVPAQQRS